MSRSLACSLSYIQRVFVIVVLVCIGKPSKGIDQTFFRKNRLHVIIPKACFPNTLIPTKILGEGMVPEVRGGDAWCLRIKKGMVPEVREGDGAWW